MKAAIFPEPGRIVLGEKPMPEPGSLDALTRITTSTIRGTVSGYAVGQRVIAGAITS